MLTILLPITLAWIMFCVGLQLTVKDFYLVFKYPKWIVIGVFSQIIVIPLIVFLMVNSFMIPSTIAIGLYLVALSPGGNTSNAISALIGGNVALSATLTAITSLIVPFTFPLFLSFFIGETSLVISKSKIMLQLLLISAIPMLIGMCINAMSKNYLLNIKKVVSKTTLPALFIVILITVLSNRSILLSLISGAAFFALFLCITAMIVGFLIAKLFAADVKTSKTLMIEVGIQNAGIAIFVAIHQLGDPSLAITPLLYGILMNIPVLLIIWYKKSI